MFYVYVLFLIASGVMMLAMGSFRAAYARRGRIVNLVVGTGFTVYGLYLLLFFRDGHYFLFLYAFILPVLLAVRFFRDRAAAGGGQRGMAPAGYGNGSQPPPYGNFPPPAGYGNAPQPPAYGAPQPPADGNFPPAPAPAYGNAPQPPYGNAPQAPAYGQGNVPPAYGNAPYGQPQQPQQQPPYQGGSWS
jgi:hypothetical protein